MRARLLLTVLLWAAVTFAAVDDAVAKTREKQCGTKRLHGERLTVWVVGDPIACVRAREIARGPCDDRRPWTCIGLRAPDPIIVWLRYSELFADHPSSAIEARRPERPCGGRPVTRRQWRAARDLKGYPTLRQMLADDLIRCQQLKGMSRREVRRLLPDKDESDKQGDAWLLGPERQLFQVDSEYLSVTYTHRRTVKKVEIFQG